MEIACSTGSAEPNFFRFPPNLSCFLPNSYQIIIKFYHILPYFTKFTEFYKKILSKFYIFFTNFVIPAVLWQLQCYCFFQLWNGEGLPTGLPCPVVEQLQVPGFVKYKLDFFQKVLAHSLDRGFVCGD